MRGLIMAFCITAALLPINAKAEFDPVQLYGKQIAFDVLRNGQVVGEHITSFYSQNDGYMVQSHMTLSIGVLFIPLYDFTYDSRERWADNQLNHIRVSVDDAGKHFDLAGDRKDEKFKISFRMEKYAVTGNVFATNHWHPGVVRKPYREVLNTLTGNMNKVTIQPNPPEAVEVKGGVVMATRYDYSGQLHDTSSWYDQDGRWIKLRFKAKDGSEIEYLCRTCKPEIPT